MVNCHREKWVGKLSLNPFSSGAGCFKSAEGWAIITNKMTNTLEKFWTF